MLINFSVFWIFSMGTKFDMLKFHKDLKEDFNHEKKQN